RKRRERQTGYSRAVRVTLADLRRQHAPLEGELREAFARVLGSGKFVLGDEVAAFEEELARAAGVRFAVGVSSGTDALLAALAALGVGPGDEVVTSALSFFASAAAAARLGARPVFADISGDLCIDAADALRRRGARTR